MLARRTLRDDTIVLIVDADPDSRAMYAEYLRHHGLRTIAVSTAQHALTLARDVDAIVTELLLPGSVDGIGLIERLKADRATRDIPLIVVTVCAWTTERARAERAGCDLFLSKPCLPDQLTREVQRLLAASFRSNASAGRHK